MWNYKLRLVLLGCFAFFACSERPGEPQRPAHVPVQAIWVGGSDGGVWLQLVNTVSDSAFRVRIFNEKNGNIVADTIFSIINGCEFKKVDSFYILKYANAYDGKNIFLLSPNNGGNCVLNPR